MKIIKLKNNYAIDSSSVSHNKKILKDVLNEVLLYDNYLVQGESTNIGSLSNFKRIDIIVYANGCHGSMSLPIDSLGQFGIVWSAYDNRLAHYYLAGNIDIAGNLSVLHTGYFRHDTSGDYERSYGIKKVIGHK